MLKRGSGILLHVSSLPSDYGIGDLGPGAYDFLDVLKAARQRYWQVLPMNPTDSIYGESPYSSPSAFACNPLFISPVRMYEAGWLTKDEAVGVCPSGRQVDFATARDIKRRVLQKGFERFDQGKESKESFQEFCRRQSFWLNDYAMFMVLKQLYLGKRWDQWPAEIRKREPAARVAFQKKYVKELEAVKFGQFIFWQQWQVLRAHCHELGVQLIGDIPIYVNDDGADVWAHPHFFKLNSRLRPNFVAGVPPDYFSATGQRWGNPVYDWEKLKEEGYEWWMQRLARQFELFDVVRIDHFRAFEAYWEIPVKEETAVNGQWVDGPKAAFFEILQERFSGLPIIGEDLGIITPEVTALMQRFSIPGMKVLQFAFSDDDMEHHPYLPHNYQQNCVVYTGTHDNNTTVGWFREEAHEREREHLKTYLGKEPSDGTISWDLIRLAANSVADLSIVPLQDILALDSADRMNRPGTVEGNWAWRYVPGQIPEEAVEQLLLLTEEAQRGS